MGYNRNKKHRTKDYQTDNKNRKRKNRDFAPRVKYNGKRPSNVSVYLKDNEDPMRAIKRFIKKCKKEKKGKRKAVALLSHKQAFCSVCYYLFLKSIKRN